MISAAAEEDPNFLYPISAFHRDLGDEGITLRLTHRIDSLQRELLTLFTCQSLPTIAAREVVINEIVASNDSLSGITDLTGEYDDWIELYNTTDSAIDLSNAFLSDKYDNLRKWPFLEGTTIPARGYVIVWADEDGGDPGLHANFKLSRGGESLYFTNADGSYIDSLNFGEQAANVALARVPNGTGAFVQQHTTWKFSNDSPVATRQQTQKIALRVFPNPTEGVLQVDVQEATRQPYTFEVYSITGQLVVVDQALTANRITFHLGTMPPGFYLLKVRGENGQTGALRFIKQ